MRLPTAHLGSVLYVLCLITLVAVPATSYWASHRPSTPAAHSMTPFSSYDELRHFVLTESCTGSGTRGLYNPNPAPVPTGPVAQNGNGLFTTAVSGSSSTSSVPTYSHTNPQVAGVDELDMVKTDGTYLYTVTNNTVVIVLAYHVAAAKEVARISVNSTIQGIFIDGNRIVIISQHFPYYYSIAYVTTGGPSMVGATSMIAWPIYSYDQTSSIWIYDVSNHSTPNLTTTVV